MSKNSISAAAYFRVNMVLFVDQSGKKSRKKAFLSEENGKVNGLRREG